MQQIGYAYIGHDRIQSVVPEKEFKSIPGTHHTLAMRGHAFIRAVMDENNRCVGWCNKAVASEDSENPFIRICRAGKVDESIRLALIFKSSHQASDVWMGCRLDRALRGYIDNGLSPLLNGRLFVDYIDAVNGTIPRFHELVDCANDFLSHIQSVEKT